MKTAKLVSLKQSQGFGLTNNQLKIFAMIAMLIDHIGYWFFPTNEYLRYIGRLSFPVFAYMIAEGCFYTRDRGRYLSNVAALALLCQAVYLVFMGSAQQGILITFTLSIVSVCSIDGFFWQKRIWIKAACVFAFLGVLFLALVAPVLYKGYGFIIDYGVFGVALPVGLYYTKGKWSKIFCCGLFLTGVALMLGGRQWLGLAALPILALYNGKKGEVNLKYAFYIFYPSHLALIYLISMLL